MAFTRLEERKRKNLGHAKDAFHNELIFLEKIKRVFNSADGLLVLDWILDQCGVLDSIFTGNSQTFYNSGRQDFGNELVSLVIKADPNIYHRLVDLWTTQLEQNKADYLRELEGN